MTLSLLSSPADSLGFQALVYDDAGEYWLMQRETLQIKPSPVLQFRAETGAEIEEQGQTEEMDWIIALTHRTFQMKTFRT